MRTARPSGSRSTSARRREPAQAAAGEARLDPDARASAPGAQRRGRAEQRLVHLAARAAGAARATTGAPAAARPRRRAGAPTVALHRAPARGQRDPAPRHRRPARRRRAPPDEQRLGVEQRRPPAAAPSPSAAAAERRAHALTAPASPRSRRRSRRGARPRPGPDRLGRQHEAVGEHGLGERLDVVGQRVVAALEQRAAPWRRAAASGPARGLAPSSTRGSARVWPSSATT